MVFRICTSIEAAGIANSIAVDVPLGSDFVLPARTYPPSCITERTTQHLDTAR